MKSSMYTQLLEIRKGNEEIVEDIIGIFNPLLNKYSKLLDGEDTRQDLILYLLKIINKIPIDSFNDDRAIFSYISKAIRNEYIKLSKKLDRKNINEVELNLEIEIGHENFDSEMEIIDLFKILTERESYIIKLIYVYYLSVSEVAQFLKISRQSVNKTKNRALKKLKEVYLE